MSFTGGQAISPKASNGNSEAVLSRERGEDFLERGELVAGGR
jgi:hypothetical protein